MVPPTEPAPAAQTPPTESPPCNWCGSTELKAWYAYEHMGIGRCPECDLVFTSPRETFAAAAARYSAEEYYQTDELTRFGYDDYGSHRAIHERVFKQALTRLAAVMPEKGKLLDVGCAMGFLLHVAREEGWQPEGADLSTWACAEARRLTGLPVHEGDITTLAIDPAQYDALTMFDVIEHVYDPRATVQACARLLKPGGLLYLITPNVSGFQRRLMGKRWFHFKPLEHTYYFDRTTLRRFLEEAGFEVVKAQRNLRWVTPRFVTERLQYYSAPIAKILHALVGRWGWSAKLQLPLFTGEIEVIARRKAD